MRILTIFIFLLFVCGCNPQKCYYNNYQNITDYGISPNTETPNGIAVDTSEFDVDLEEIDRQVDSLESCLREAFAENSLIDEETAVAQDCRVDGFGLRREFDLEFTINRDCLIVKIASDWSVSSCSGQQVFPCDINPAVCEAKGIEVTDECPCMCRSMLQDENTVVTTPNLYLFRGELARMVTGCNNPWFAPISQCLVD
ncbi:MAG: hypothetical protein U9P90_00570 [Patescibacteria group bacterium]|nr:hypothetical protein [Patescibacteria group bacterium]